MKIIIVGGKRHLQQYIGFIVFCVTPPVIKPTNCGKHVNHYITKAIRTQNIQRFKTKRVCLVCMTCFWNILYHGRPQSKD